MTFTPGDMVDWNPLGNIREKWHGKVVALLEGGQILVTWTASTRKKTTMVNARKTQYTLPHFELLVPADLVACEGGLGPKHPSSNPWGDELKKTKN